MRIGIDLGGTKIEGAALGPDGAFLERRRIAAPQNDYDATVRAIRDLVFEIEAAQGTEASVGVGTPGALCPTEKVIKNANSTWLIGRPLDKDLETALGRPVRLENDANCFALSEATDGAAAGQSVVFGVILGTGCGGGLVIDGRSVIGTNAIAGEWGHCPLPAPSDAERPGTKCYCGRYGCIETWLCGSALTQSWLDETGERRSPAAIAEAARGGDPRARATLDLYTDRLARSLSLIVNILDPDVIVLGGGLSNIAELYSLTPPKLKTHAFSPTLKTRIVPPKHGDSSGVRGAAWLWPKDAPPTAP